MLNGEELFNCIRGVDGLVDEQLKVGSKQAVVVDCALYQAGRRVRALSLERAAEAAKTPDGFVWIALHQPDSAMLKQLQAQFNLHELTIEDALHAHQRPKVDLYDDAIFLVLHTARLHKHVLKFGETHLFAGRGYVICVRHGEEHLFTELTRQFERSVTMLNHGEDFMLYALMDFVVDQYMPVLDVMEEEAREIESMIFGDRVDRQLVAEVYRLKRSLWRMRSMVAPVVDICMRLQRADNDFIDPQMQPYYSDVHDHALRINSRIDSLRELVSSALDANLLLASLHQNEVMRKLAAYAAMLAVPTAVAGIYGMNFDYMPELSWPLGYPLALGGMASICGYLYWRFKKAHWL